MATQTACIEANFPGQILDNAADLFAQRVIGRASEFLETLIKLQPVVARALPKCVNYVLLEFGAYLELTAWEHCGIMKLLPWFTLSAGEARTLVVESIRQRIYKTTGPDAFPIFRLLITAWLVQCAWQGDNFFESAFAIDFLDGELADRLAHFIWENRRTLHAALNNIGGTS